MKFRWPVAVAAIIVTIALLIGIDYLWQVKMQDQPLFQLLEQKEEVLDFRVDKEDPLLIQVELGNVDDFPRFYKQFRLELDRIVGKDNYTLIVTNNPPSKYESALENAVLAMYEGERLGNYAEMGERIKTEFSQAGLDDYSISMDEDGIYLQVNLEEGCFYRFVPRLQREEAQA